MKTNIINIWLEKSFLILDQDETICPICKGIGGWYPFTKDEPSGLKLITMCTHCEGKGKIDWVTRIMNPPRNEEREKLKSKWRVGSKAWQKIY
jgi:DnaJ-class molecular chaperone